ncbi:hypothetical protein AWJ20_2648 [Sugiyamaella lignohabitans]|uniref:Triacylglycerol lipase n=1 Tax=Sugiyamaella lignohabitans TaxID=796027 RepID=A0A167FAA4_9ASCO|nr:uncharacterized protein AWJ20_2648 [Sugiyamaella lignohabitans]ANB15028.1 hypothetical protein AWJ20_2648 [Sugiyamaella lignohabitans]
MRLSILEAAILLSVFSVGSGADSTLSPADDPFYSPPSGYESSTPGTILKSRSVPSPLVGLTYEKAYQLLYRTTSATGGAEADVTTIIVPKGTPKDILLSYQVPEDANWVNCAPSYGLLTSNSSSNADFQTILDLGWYLSVPDYEGPASSFTAGIKSGYSTLDSVRAVLGSNNDSGIPDSVKIGLWGYSGGSIASVSRIFQ